MQILILGMHRSGTSMVTRLVNMMGAYFGTPEESIGQNEENPKGFWERQDVVRTNDALLKNAGATWDNPQSWDARVPADPPLSERLSQIVASLDRHGTWVMKDPRLCLTLPCWLPHLTSPFTLLVYRHPVEIAHSLLVRNGIPLPCGLALWETYMLHALHAAKHLPVGFISHAECIRAPVAAAKRLFRIVRKHDRKHLKLPEKLDILNFIDPALHRSGRKGIEDESLLNGAQQHLWKTLRRETTPKNIPPLSAGASECLEIYRELSRLRALENSTRAATNIV